MWAVEGMATKRATPGSAGQNLSGLFTTLAALGVTAVWTVTSMAFVGGFEFWLGSRENQAHLALNLICTFVAAAYAYRLHGPLDYKFGQALLVTAVLFGLYALTILGGRLFFSRSMLLSAVLLTAAVTVLIVALRHRLSRNRVAVIGPLIGEGRLSLPNSQVVTDPETDLRAFDIVLVSLTEAVSADWARALSRAMLTGCRVRHIGEYIEELRGAVSLDHFEVDHLPPNGIASYRMIKRAMDIGLVIFILPVVLPVLALSMFAILVTSGAPVFFIQERVGLGAAPFEMWKLRTMRTERPDEALKAAVIGDSRVTPVGRVLRRFRIDELPQLWNVLKGDMSLIGPRPEAVPLHTDYQGKLPNYAYRYLVRPGITGWAQVNAPPSASADEAKLKLTYDLYYVKKLSLWLDVQIVMRTFWTITSGGGVR
jgi:lipopolysaccharide/colanic/teichoic acid biosynthesis glycosyltransferase